MTKIEQLESKLNESLRTQHILHERLKNDIKTLKTVESRLKVIDNHLERLNDYIDTLKQENRGLKLSCNSWMNRAIKLEFEILRTRDESKK